MGLLDLKTNLKSLKYGNDQRGGGSSNQPYVVTPIPDGFAPTSPDFLLRNGYLNPINSLQDVSRLTKFFLDTKSPNGILFTAKQQLLERQNPLPFPDSGFSRIYNPLNTITQAGVLSAGYHLNKQGLNPFSQGYFDGGRDGYFYQAKDADQMASSGGVDRLVLLYKGKQTETPTGLGSGETLYGISSNSGLLLSYSGGPNSIGGFGKTNIRITSDRTNLIPNYIKDNSKFIVGASPKWIYNPSYNINPNGQPGLSVRYVSDLNLNEEEIYETFYTPNPENILNRDVKSTGLTGETFQQSQLNALNDVYVLTQKQIIDKSYTDPQGVHGIGMSNTLTDFRYKDLIDKPIPKTDYVNFNREKTYNTGVTEYKPQIRLTNPNKSYKNRIDEQNNLEPQNENDFAFDDLIKFYIETISNKPSGGNEFLYFRAYLNNISDDFKGGWQNYKYVGRAENFYKYNEFSREISLSFTIYAHTRAEMIPIYSKLNRLAGITAPSYSEIGLMRGNFVRMTIGDYLDNTPGIIQSVNLKPSFEAGWDINRDENGTPINTNSTDYVGQLPRMIDVDLSFTPIHDFTPTNNSTYIGNEGII